MAGRKEDKRGFKEVRNTKAFQKCIISDKYESGVVLEGTEVKSVRAGKAQISKAFVRFYKGEPILYDAHIEEYKFGTDSNHNPIRPRKLLLHKKEIEKIRIALEAGGFTVVPLKLYLAHGLVKVEIALAKGKKLHDKRETLKKKTMLREAERDIQKHKR